MKKCIKCNKLKTIYEFSFKKIIDNKRHSICKSCYLDYSKIHYSKNRTKYINRAKKNKHQYLKRNKEIVISYLSSHPCVDCGEDDINVLQFDHIERVNGRKNRKVICGSVGSIETLLNEISKCEIRCANCHIKRTRSQMKWFR